MRFPLDHIVIYAADAATSDAFYSALLPLLGFEKRRAQLFARAGLFIDIRDMLHASPAYERGRRGVDHIGFKAADRDAVDDVVTVMASAGFPGKLLTFDNGDYAFFATDPDGVRTEITCYANPDADPVD